MKIFKIILTTCLCSLLSLTFFATESNDFKFYYSDMNITVTFNANSQLSHAEMQRIANKLVLVESSEESASTYRWCWLLGHDLTTETVEVIEHKVYATNPRCVKRLYTVETCSGCDYVNEVLEATSKLLCCPVE